MQYWQQIVQMYFSEKATMKLTLWKDNQQVEAKPFGMSPRYMCQTKDTESFLQRLDFPSFHGFSW